MASSHDFVLTLCWCVLLCLCLYGYVRIKLLVVCFALELFMISSNFGSCYTAWFVRLSIDFFPNARFMYLFVNMFSSSLTFQIPSYFCCCSSYTSLWICLYCLNSPLLNKFMLTPSDSSSFPNLSNLFEIFFTSISLQPPLYLLHTSTIWPTVEHTKQ